MRTTKPQVGSPVAPFISDVDLWSTILDMVADYQSGGAMNKNPKGGSFAAGAIVVVNDEDDQIPAGELRQLSGLTNQESYILADDAFRRSTVNSPAFTLTDPVWHTGIDNVVLMHKNVLPHSTGVARSARLVAAPITNAPEELTEVGWVMVDPLDPVRLKYCKTSGIYRVLGWFKLDGLAAPQDNIVVIDTQEKQNIWMYELTQDSLAPNDTSAKLLDLEETVFAANIKLWDPQSLMDDQSTGDRGYCLHLGNKFLAIQAVCDVP